RLNKPAIQGSRIFLNLQENVRAFETEVPENHRSISNYGMNEKMDREEYRDARKHRQRNKWIFAAMMINFRDQIACSHVKRYSARYRQSVCNGKAQIISREIEQDH